MRFSKKLKVHCHAIQCFYVVFLRSKMAARKLKAAPPTNELPVLGRNFFFTLWELRDWLTSKYQSVVLAKSFFSLSVGWSWAMRYDQESEKKNLPINNGDNIMESKTGPQSFMERSWVVRLVRQSFKTRDLSVLVVYISLHSTICTTTIRQSTLKTLVERASLGKIHGCHYSPPPPPPTKWRKNHWIAWQCTFKFDEVSAFFRHFCVSKVLSAAQIKKLRPKMTKIASRGRTP